MIFNTGMDIIFRPDDQKFVLSLATSTYYSAESESCIAYPSDPGIKTGYQNKPDGSYTILDLNFFVPVSVTVEEV
jgi:hypothetical protein